MAVAEPCLKVEWEEWKTGMEEKRRRRWTEKVRYWATLEVSDNEEEEVSECEAGEGNVVERKENEMRVKGKWSEEEEEEGGVGWEEGEDGGDVTEAQVNEEDVEKKVKMENERAVVLKVEDRLMDDEEGQQHDEEEHQDLENTGEGDMAEQVQVRPGDPIGEREPPTCVAEVLQNHLKDPQVLEEEEKVEGENEVHEGVGAPEKMVAAEAHGYEEEPELEETGEKDWAEQDHDERSKKEEEEVEDLSEHNNQEEDCFTDRSNDEERDAERPEQNNENSLLEGQRKLADEAEMVAEPPTDDPECLEEEESDEEEAGDEDVYEDVVKTYCMDGYVSEAFGTLEDFRDASLLTDLTLSTTDGRSVQAHAPVLAAVSSLVWEHLRGRTSENTGIHICLGPEVDGVGLEAVVEFAYAGSVSCLNEDTVHQIKAAAGTLGASRVMELCRQEEESPGDRPREERVLTEQQITLQAIKKMRTDKVGCDVILEAIGGSLHVHRVILAVCSDYFRCMFTSGMKECRQPRVSLPALWASELEALIICSYGGELPLSWGCAFEVTSTALQLQHRPALRLCLDFMQQELNPHFCLDVASFAEAYALAELLDVSHDYVLRQFQKVASTSKFKDLPAEQLLRYLNSHSLCVPSELVVFKAVVAWIQAKPKKRLGLAKELLKTVQFPLMTYKDFKEVQSLEMWSDHGLEELYEAIFEDFCGSDAIPQSQYRTYLPKESLVMIGGDQTSEDLDRRRICRELWFANSIRSHTGIRKATEWRRLAEMPDQGRHRHEVAVLKGQLYVLGGKKYYGIYDTLNSVYRYDPLQNSWDILAEMKEKRCSFAAVVLDGKIYAMGGHCDPDNIESVERYCPLTNTWSYASPLDLPLSAHAASVLHGQVYVSGGLDSGFRCVASTFVYHPQTGGAYLANMVNRRAQHCMEVLGDRLYAAGGITTDDDAATLDLLPCETYDPTADCWTAFEPLPVPHVGAGSAVLEGKFYVLGGYSQEDYSDTPMVHRYDPTAQRWENTGRTPGPNNDIRAAVLRLPPHLRA